MVRVTNRDPILAKMHKKDAKSSGRGSHPRGIHPTASGRWIKEEFFCSLLLLGGGGGKRGKRANKADETTQTDTKTKFDWLII